MLFVAGYEPEVFVVVAWRSNRQVIIVARSESNGIVKYHLFPYVDTELGVRDGVLPNCFAFLVAEGKYSVAFWGASAAEHKNVDLCEVFLGWYKVDRRHGSNAAPLRVGIFGYDCGAWRLFLSGDVCAGDRLSVFVHYFARYR